MPLMASDVGPNCAHCQGTIWSYDVCFDKENTYTVKAKCIGCRKVDPGFNKLAWFRAGEPIIQYVRGEHWRKCAPYPWCGNPEYCARKGYCDRNPSCGD